MTQPRPSASVESPFRPLAQAFLIALELSFFTEPDFEENEQQGTSQSGRHQDDRQDFACDFPDQYGARATCDDERRGRAERHDA